MGRSDAHLRDGAERLQGVLQLGCLRALRRQRRQRRLQRRLTTLACSLLVLTAACGSGGGNGINSAARAKHVSSTSASTTTKVTSPATTAVAPPTAPPATQPPQTAPPQTAAPVDPLVKAAIDYQVAQGWPDRNLVIDNVKYSAEGSWATANWHPVNVDYSTFQGSTMVLKGSGGSWAVVGDGTAGIGCNTGIPDDQADSLGIGHSTGPNC
jgi:hypothetical protein